jgi:hypothetical protein
MNAKRRYRRRRRRNRRLQQLERALLGESTWLRRVSIVECIECHGSGEVSEYDIDYSGHSRGLVLVSCYLCDGAGYVTSDNPRWDEANEAIFRAHGYGY